MRSAATMSLRALSAQIASGEVTPTEHIEEVLQSLDSLAGTPWANLVSFRDDDRARFDAKRHTARIASGWARGPLDGIAVAVKDNIDVEGMPTGLGSNYGANREVADRDADIVSRLRSRGAIIVAKTHLHELAYGSTGTVNASGPARNPHDPDRITGGSSSGSAALAALGAVPLAIGTETGCSVRAPAALCGVAGIMPALGTLSNEGVMPVSPTFDHVGLIAGTAADLELAWSDLVTARPHRWPPGAVRVGRPIASNLHVDDPATLSAVDLYIDRIVTQGCEVMDVALPELADLLDQYPIVVGYEMRARYNDALHQSPNRFQSELRDRLEANARYRETDYKEALRQVSLLRRKIRNHIAEAGVDALVLATTPWAAPRVGQESVSGEPVGDALLRLCAPFSSLGTPAISIPVATSPLPLGIQVVGTTLNEAELLAFSATLSSESGVGNADD